MARPMEPLTALAGFACLLGFVTLLGHGIWVVCRAILQGISASPGQDRPPRGRRTTCPACLGRLDGAYESCPACGLRLHGSRIRELERLRFAQSEVRALADRETLDRETADRVTAQLDDRI